MKRSLVAAGVAAVLAIGGGAWVGLGSANATATVKPFIHGWPSSAASPTATITAAKAAAVTPGSQVLLLREHIVRETEIDVGSVGFGPGDYFIFEGKLRYLHGSAIVGRDSVRCTVGPTTFICDASFYLFGKGKIVAYGAKFGPDIPRIAVTGGTGDFLGVGGQLNRATLRGGDTLLAFNLTR